MKRVLIFGVSMYIGFTLRPSPPERAIAMDPALFMQTCTKTDHSSHYVETCRCIMDALTGLKPSEINLPGIVGQCRSNPVPF